jgi:hypothetical protein
VASLLPWRLPIWVDADPCLVPTGARPSRLGSRALHAIGIDANTDLRRRRSRVGARSLLSWCVPAPDPGNLIPGAHEPNPGTFSGHHGCGHSSLRHGQGQGCRESDPGENASKLPMRHCETSPVRGPGWSLDGSAVHGHQSTECSAPSLADREETSSSKRRAKRAFPLQATRPLGFRNVGLLEPRSMSDSNTKQ